ncbi:hypothetical protein BKA66DRAFT_439942 [Pyrenochaeta sp. MPI-SDFR-AT-0127]|nr:hypothetical protein BKA66DRAFT_439942 [Pyrenochaeta sp. MPI-SDFR-AT-0127]
MQKSDMSLTSDHFQVQLHSKNASIQTLRNPADRYGSNYVLNAVQAPDFDIKDSRFLGDLIFHVKRDDEDAGKTMTSGLSGDVRSVLSSDDRIIISYQGAANDPGGFQGFSVTEMYSLCGPKRDTLDWTIEVTNESSEILHFEDFGLPMPMNSRWGNDQTHNYENGVHRHSFVAKYGSYIYWQRPNGEGSMLVMTTHRNTSLEFKHRYREGENVFGENLPNWEGLVEYYVHSSNIAVARKDMAGQYLPATTLTLPPGRSQKYGFSFKWAADYAGLRNAIYMSGGLDVVSMPGMVIPRNTTATLALRCVDCVSSVAGEDGKAVNVTTTGSSNGYDIYNLKFSTLGTNYITVSLGDSRWTVLQYYCTEPITTLIKKRAGFLAQYQQAKTSRGYNGAFLQWDMTTQKLITWDDYPGGGWKEWMAGGSDDLGLAPAAFLSEKCVTFPVQFEVSSIDYYIEHFLFGYLLGAKGPDGERTFQVYRWFDGQDSVPEDTGIWRAYNYTHIANTFFNMYRIGKAYPRLHTRYKPLEYLRFAYEVLNAMYCKIPVPNPIGNAANELGLMGESTVPEIMNALDSEGLSSQKQILQDCLQRKLEYYKNVKYPFASEQSIDTTGFESVYAFSKYKGMRDLMDKSQKASLASRGLQPLWYFYGSDNRMMGESYWNLGYEAQLGAWQQQDYLINYSTQQHPNFADSLRSSYGAYLAGWSNINSGQIDSSPANIGAAAWLWQSEGGTAVWPWMRLIGRWWAWSGEVDLGLWGALRAASVLVVQDPIVELYAYGGTVAIDEGKYRIKPTDGLQRRLTLFNLNNLTVEIANAQFSEVIVGETGNVLEIDLQAPSGVTCTPTITLMHASDGNYEGFYSGSTEKQRLSVNKGSTVVFVFSEMSSEHGKAIIQRA